MAGNADIWVTDLRRSSSTRMTFGDAREIDPIWSPDGAHLAFRRGSGEVGIYVIDANGAGNEKRLADRAGMVTSWSPDGRHLLVMFNTDLALVPVEGREADS